MASLNESMAIADLAEHLYDYLPANPHPYANKAISFPGVAAQLGLERYWQGGSKRPAITSFLTKLLDHDRGRFCPFMLNAVKTALGYRRQKREPLCREDIDALNKLILRVGFKIPELYDPKFLDGLPRKAGTNEQQNPGAGAGELRKLNEALVRLAQLKGQERGFAFEKFLSELFAVFNFAPRGSFRLVGEQIDGSFELDSTVYLLEAKWQDLPVGLAELLTFSGKVGGKATWSRGLIVSYSGYSAEGLEAYGRGRATCIICMDGLDLHEVLSGKLDLREVLRRKARGASETNSAFIRVRDLF